MFVKSIFRFSFIAIIVAGTPAFGLNPEDSNRQTETPLSGYLVKARQLESEGRYAEIITLFNSLPWNNHNGESLVMLGDAHARQSNLPQAQTCYVEAIRSGEETAETRFKLGQVYLLQRKYGLAIESLNISQQLGLSNVDLHYCLAKAYMQTGNYTGKLTSASLADKTAGQFTDTHYIVERYSEKHNSFLLAPPESAIYQLHLAIKQGLNTLDANLMAAETWLKIHRYKKAVETYSAHLLEIENSPLTAEEKAEIHFSWANALYGNDDMEGYLEHLKHAASLDSKKFTTPLRESYAKIAARYNQRGDLKKYIKYMELASTEFLHNPELHYRLGNAYWEAGNTQSAVEQWNITLQLAPDHPDKKRMLSHIQDSLGI